MRKNIKNFTILLLLLFSTSFAYSSQDYSSEYKKDPIQVLDADDLEKYNKVYNLHGKGKFKQAQKALESINNKLLFGYLLYQKYIHKDYKSSFTELKTWLDKYYDLPVAERIYNLALSKKEKSTPQSTLKTPLKIIRPGYYYNVENTALPRLIQNKYTNKKTLNYIDKYKAELKKGHTKNVKDIINTKYVKDNLKPDDYYRLVSNLAYKYFIDNLYEDAIHWAKKSSKNQNDPIANWVLGLSYYKLQNWDKSKTSFEKLSKNNKISADKKSASLFWSYKALEKKFIQENSQAQQTPDDEISFTNQQTEELNSFVEKAAKYPNTFYGTIARHKLGLNTYPTWLYPEFTEDHKKTLLSSKRAKRAIALLQMDFENEAQEEFKYLLYSDKSNNSEELITSVFTFAHYANMSYISIQTAPYFKNDEGNLLYNSSLYPDIILDNENNWHMDKALIKAFIRQESRFNKKAKSYSGAIGLMQLMPSTAKWIESKDGSKGLVKNLYSKDYNVYVGQKYIDYLLKLPAVKNDLIKLIISYNAGPGNMINWRKRMDENFDSKNDPLFFIESIRIKETRMFTKKVFTNLWNYREKYGQEKPSLDALIKNNWPKYIPQDK